MTPAEQRLSEIAFKIYPPSFVGGIDILAARREGVFEGFRKALDQPEVKALVEAAKATQKYDAAIFVSARNGDLVLDPLGALAGGQDLDALYMDMKTKTEKALSQWKNFAGDK
ncbi:hypothetical protein D3C87_125420 [compost metagenome]